MNDNCGEGLADQIKDLQDAVGRIEWSVGEVKDRVEALDMAVRGNGIPGLSSRVMVLENIVESYGAFSLPGLFYAAMIVAVAAIVAFFVW